VGGCEVRYEDAAILEELTETTPELEIAEPQYTFIRNSARIIRLSAESAELFAARNEQHFTNLAFIEVQRADNETLNSGSADSATYFVNSGNFELRGNVQFRSVEQNATVSAEYLLWDNEAERLTGRARDFVTVTRPSGTIMRGRNLVADLANRTIEFEDAAGTIIPEQDEQGDEE